MVYFVHISKYKNFIYLKFLGQKMGKIILFSQYLNLIVLLFWDKNFGVKKSMIADLNVSALNRINTN